MATDMATGIAPSTTLLRGVLIIPVSETSPPLKLPGSQVWGFLLMSLTDHVPLAISKQRFVVPAVSSIHPKTKCFSRFGGSPTACMNWN